MLQDIDSLARAGQKRFHFISPYMNRKSFRRLIVIAIGLVVVVSGLLLPAIPSARPRLRATHSHGMNYVDPASLSLTFTINTDALTNGQSQVP
jgi:hypothetical protein